MLGRGHGRTSLDRYLEGIHLGRWIRLGGQRLQSILSECGSCAFWLGGGDLPRVVHRVLLERHWHERRLW